MQTSGYYAPLTVTATYRPTQAWTLDVGTTPDGKWVVEAQSIASARPQRLYFDTEAEAVAYASDFAKGAPRSSQAKEGT
jgi:hypothetical protein